jgi:hypothetical protein
MQSVIFIWIIHLGMTIQTESSRRVFRFHNHNVYDVHGAKRARHLNAESGSKQLPPDVHENGLRSVAGNPRRCRRLQLKLTSNEHLTVVSNNHHAVVAV